MFDPVFTWLSSLWSVGEESGGLSGLWSVVPVLRSLGILVNTTLCPGF